MRTAFGIRGLSSAYISRVFLRTEMALKSRSVLTGSRSLARSRSTDNLPTSQSQVNIQMMSHTLTIREVCYPYSYSSESLNKNVLDKWTHVHAKILLHSIWLSLFLNFYELFSPVNFVVIDTIGMLTNALLSSLFSEYTKFIFMNDVHICEPITFF